MYLKWLKVKRLPRVSKGMERLELSDVASRNANWYCHFATIWYFLTCLKIQLPFPQKYGSWVFFKKKKWKHVYMKTCTCVHLKSLFTATKSEKWPKCLSVNGWISNIVFPYNEMLFNLKKTRVWGDGSVEHLLYKNKKLSLIPRTQVLI